MRKHATLVVGAALVALATMSTGTVRAEGLDPIAVRQAAFSLNGGDFAFIRAVVEAKGDVKPLETPAKAIAKWAAVIPTVFPKVSETGGNTKALPEIWSDPAGFQKIALHLGEAATKLAAVAKAGDADAVAADTKAMGQACGACHRTYRAK